MKKLLVLILLLAGFVASEAQTIVTSTNASTNVKYEKKEREKKEREKKEREKKERKPSTRIKGLYLRPEGLLGGNIPSSEFCYGIQGTLLYQIGPYFNVGAGGGYLNTSAFSAFARMAVFLGNHLSGDFYIALKLGVKKGTINDDYYNSLEYDGFFIECEIPAFNYKNWDFALCLGDSSTISYRNFFDFIISFNVAYNIPLSKKHSR